MKYEYIYIPLLAYPHLNRTYRIWFDTRRTKFIDEVLIPKTVIYFNTNMGP
jgi:hypothetical protein